MKLAPGIFLPNIDLNNGCKIPSKLLNANATTKYVTAKGNNNRRPIMYRYLI